jgi:hypothetical protein
MADSIEVLIPGLMPPNWPVPGGDNLSVRELERALGQASTQGRPFRSQDARDQLRHFEARLAYRFGLDQPLASAPYAYLADSGERPETTVMAVAPVHLRPEQDRLVLFEGEPLALTTEESAALVARLNDHFADRGLRLVAPKPQRWYLLDPPQARITTTPLYQVNGRNINQELPQGEDARFWAATLNEIQMLLHQDLVNQAREAQGQWLVNGLWPHGLGRLQPTQAPTGVWGDQPLVRGLALAAGVGPASPAAWRPEAAGGEGLLVIEQLVDPMLIGDMEAWRGRLEEVAEQLAPLLRWAEQGGELKLDPCNGQRFNINRLGKLRFWRKRRLFQCNRSPPAWE